MRKDHENMYCWAIMIMVFSAVNLIKYDLQGSL